MKRSFAILRKISAYVLSVVFVFTLFSIVPIVKVDAAAPAYSESFVQQLIKQHPLSEGQIYVGYGRRDITPIPIDNTGNTGVGLGGYGRDEYRIGIWGGNNTVSQHALMSYCIAVMDESGSIILFCTNDFSQSGRYKEIRAKISAKTGVPEGRIQVSGNHTHSAVTQSSSPATKIRGCLTAHFEYQDEQIALACADAINDLYPSDVYTKTVELKDGDQNVAAFVRQYNLANGIADHNGKQLIGSDNHGYIYWNSSSNKWAWNGTGNRTSHVTDGDAQVQVVRYERADNNNILMCNFQSHPQGMASSTSTIITPDWIADFRDGIESAAPNYRVAFYQGAAGNLNIRSSFTSEQRTYTNTSGSNKTYYFNGESIIFPKGASITDWGSAITKNGITVPAEKVKRLYIYFLGNEMASYITKDLGSLASYTRVNASKVKIKEYTFTNDYAAPPENIITQKTALWLISLIWSSSNDSIKQILCGTYAFTDSQLDNMSVINESVTASEIATAKANSQRENITDEEAEIVAKFKKRVQTLINGESTLYTANGTYSFFKTSTTASNRFADTSKFSDTISQQARTRLISWLGAYCQYPDGGDIINSPYHANSIKTKLDSVGTTYTINLTAATIGDVSFVMFPSEMFDIGGMYVKENTAAKMTLFLGYTNGANGYFPAAYSFLHTSYETDTTRTSQGTLELVSGILSDLVSDLVFEDEVYEMNVGTTKTLKKADGVTDLYDNTDSFDYATYGAKYGDNNLARFSYSNSVTWVSSNTSVATVTNGRITAVGEGRAVITAVHTGTNPVKSVTSLASCTVVVSDHNHCDECAELDCNNQSHVKNDYTAWTSTTSLPTAAGHYYLANDVTLSGYANVTNDVTICLNGHTVTASSEIGALNVSSGKITICDCQKTGRIVRTGNLSEGRGIVTVSGGDFVLYSGNIDASGATGVNGTAILGGTTGTTTIAGGVIIGGTASGNGGAIYSTGKLDITGGTIEGGTAGSYGGALYAYGQTNISGGKVVGGTAGSGGSIFVSSNNMEISGGTIQGGEATTGGCISVGTGKNLTISGGVINGGIAKKGGNIYLSSNVTVNMTGGNIKLGQTINDTTTSYGGNVYLLNSTGTVFNMSGGTIEKGTAYGMGGNVCVAAGATFNMGGGTITGGVSERFTDANNTKSGGHGGNFFTTGTVNMSGGIIANGKATSNGGGNFSINSATSRFYMSGGTVKNGSAPSSRKGSVYIWNNAGVDCFVMTGGKITDDSSLERAHGFYGGGVYITDKNVSGVQVERTLNISGNAQIYNCINTTSFNASTGVNTKTYSNVYLEAGKYITVGKCVNARVAVAIEGDTGVFSIGGAAHRLCFESTNNDYNIVSSGENLAISTETDDSSIPVVLDRVGSPSDIALPTGDGIVPEPGTVKDDFVHIAISQNDAVNLETYLGKTVTGVTNTSSNGKVSLSGKTVTGVAAGGETFNVSTSSGTVKVAVAVGHYHCLVCGTYACQIHDNVLFTASSTFSIGATKNIYLTDDVVLTNRAGSDKENLTVNICLNGHTVDSAEDNRLIYMNKAGCTVSVTDCSDDGEGNATGQLVANSYSANGGSTEDPFAWAGAAVYTVSNSTFNFYRGTIDASSIRTTSSGSVITNNGTFNIYGGRIIGGSTPSYGTILNNATGTMNIYGGVIDCYNVVAQYGTAIATLGTLNINNGRIICGTHTASSSSSSPYYVSTYSGAVAIKGGTTTMNGGVIQDGTAIQETSTDSTVHRHYTGNVFVASGATFNINNGIIANGVAYCTGGNIYLASGSTVNMTGGTITGGRVYKAARDDSNQGDGPGGNVCVGGTFNMSGGTIQNGVAATHGGNVSISGNAAEFNMTGGVIKNGSVPNSCQGSGNVGIWYLAGNNTGTKFAFIMSGGTITCDANFSAPSADYSVGGIRSVNTTEEGYCNRVKIEGSAVIKDNLDFNLVNDDHVSAYLYIGELNSDSEVYITATVEKKVAYYAEPSSVSKLRLDSKSSDCQFSYNETTNELFVVQTNKKNAERFIEKYLKDKDGNYYADGSVESMRFLEENGVLAIWDALDSETKAIVNTTYHNQTGVTDVGEYIEDSHEEYVSLVGNVDSFISTYLTETEGYTTSATLDNYARLITAEDAYDLLTVMEKTSIDEIVGVSVAGLIENAKAIGDAKNFADTYLDNGAGGYITAATQSNCETILAAASAFDALTTLGKEKASEIVGTNVATLISNANAVVETAIETATTFLNNHFKAGKTKYITVIDADNCDQISASETDYNNLTTFEKSKVDEILGTSAATLILQAKTYIADKAAAETFATSTFVIDGEIITDATIDNFEAICDLWDGSAETAWDALSETQKDIVNDTISAAGCESDVETIIARAKEYMRMLKVNYIFDEDKCKYLFYSGLDNLSSYDCAGYIIDYGYAVTELFTGSACTNAKITENGMKTAAEISDTANYVYSCDYKLYMRDYNQTVTITAFLKKSDGTYVYGKSEALTLGAARELAEVIATNDGFGELIDLEDYA